MKQTISKFYAKVYGWTFLGLVASGVAAMWVNASPSVQYALYTNGWLLFGLIIFELFLVFWLVSNLKTMSTGAANGFYFLYAILNGITLSSIFVVYDIGTISIAFFTAAAMFIVMSAIGMFSKTDLSKMSGILMMGLIGIMIALLINIFLQSSQFDFIISIFTVIIFTLLTAHDTQKLKDYYAQAGDDKENLSKMATMGALALYLDFINMFLALLRIFGRN
ncbi:MAG: Bax inhibitor-1/YccA family protein [Patescibacteria group bacterium]|nr:Bax inhibitor-1/YccA family protein [Patescibacteria group bacterium]